MIVTPSPYTIQHYMKIVQFYKSPGACSGTFQEILEIDLVVNLKLLEEASFACKVPWKKDLYFWGDLVPENTFNKSALEDLLQAGVFGLKSFMCPSGINDFPMTNSSHIKVIMGYLLAGSLVGLGV
ncbi:hypothetical protein M0R45_027910 [Rubus argutus]|uniref:Uncharacterized protein n=1 Tax=Rubus argutus TaxID=59490 RepID=A0AAW1W2X3_RUBAR